MWKAVMHSNNENDAWRNTVSEVYPSRNGAGSQPTAQSEVRPGLKVTGNLLGHTSCGENEMCKAMEVSEVTEKKSRTEEK
jgi:hypothetical protein